MKDNKMRERRLSLGISFRNLARITGLFEKELCEIEEGIKTTQEIKSLIAKALGATVKGIFED